MHCPDIIYQKQTLTEDEHFIYTLSTLYFA